MTLCGDFIPCNQNACSVMAVLPCVNLNSHDDLYVIDQLDSECNIMTQYSRLNYITLLCIDKIDSERFNINIYLMSMQGTWAGNMITQAVADTLNLKIYIGESDENFMEITLVEPANARAN